MTSDLVRKGRSRKTPLRPRVPEASPHDPKWLTELERPDIESLLIRFVSTERAPRISDSGECTGLRTRVEYKPVQPLPRDTLASELEKLGTLTRRAQSALRPASSEAVMGHGLAAGNFTVMFKTIGGSPTDAHFRVVTLARSEDLAWDVLVDVTTPMPEAHHSRKGGAQRGLLEEQSDFVNRYDKTPVWSRPSTRPNTKTVTTTHKENQE